MRTLAHLNDVSDISLSIQLTATVREWEAIAEALDNGNDYVLANFKAHIRTYIRDYFDHVSSKLEIGMPYGDAKKAPSQE